MKKMSICIGITCLLCVMCILPLQAKGTLLTPHTFGFGSEEDEGVSALIEEGNLQHLTFYDSHDYPISYWIHVPKDAQGHVIKDVPIVLYLHGYSNGGNDTTTAIRHHNALLFQLIKDQDKKERQAIILVPQTPHAINPKDEEDWFKDQWVGMTPDKGEDKWTQWNFPSWDMDQIARVPNLRAVKELVLDTQKRYQSDVNRTYVTGISMGAYAIWDLISRDDSHLFAAAVPICGVGDPSKAKNMKDIPIRMYHGGQDPQVTKEASDLLYEALMDYGHVTYTVYEDEGHPSWNSAYSPVMDDDQNGKSNLEDMIDWMFLQSLQGPLDGRVDQAPLKQVLDLARLEKKEDYSHRSYRHLQQTIKEGEKLLQQATTQEELSACIQDLHAQMIHKSTQDNTFVYVLFVSGALVLVCLVFWKKKRSH